MRHLKIMIMIDVFVMLTIKSCIQSLYNYVIFLIKELMLSKLQLFPINSFPTCIFGTTEKFLCWIGANKNNFSFV